MNARRFALTTVALATACLWGPSAWALGLGRLSVQSALGETLRAEIDITSLTADESSTLALRVASPEAYRAAGVEYNAALANAQVTLQRRSDGRPVLRVVSDRPLLEPFIDVIVEASWATGRLVRIHPVARPADAHGGCTTGAQPGHCGCGTCCGTDTRDVACRTAAAHGSTGAGRSTTSTRHRGAAHRCRGKRRIPGAAG